jgi:hypothetical protein
MSSSLLASSMRCSAHRLTRWFFSLGLVSPCAFPVPAASPVTAERFDYHGWTGSVLLGNGLVEAVIVPAAGRVMQFRFAGSAKGPFWENPARRGTRADPASGEWANFGGDKSWPAPQGAWFRLIAHTWPPPAGFDGLPMEASIDGAAVTLVSPIDPHYGIRVRRRIELAPGRPVMTITTRYEKVGGPPIETGIWTITQLQDPAAVYAVLPAGPRADPPYVRQSDEPPPGLTLAGTLLSLTRDPLKNHKIGLRASTLVWVGPAEVLRLDSAVVAGATYPDNGCSAEVYTQADPLPYVELELLAPLATLKPGAASEHAMIYTLAHRAAPSPAAEIARLLRP